MTKKIPAKIKSKLLRDALATVVATYKEKSHSRRDFSFVEHCGFINFISPRSSRKNKALKEELNLTIQLLNELTIILPKVPTLEDLEQAYNSIVIRRVLNASQISYYNISHRIMTDILSASPKSFTIIVSLYNDITSLHRLLNSVRYNNTHHSITNETVAKLIRRIHHKKHRAIKVLTSYLDSIDSEWSKNKIDSHNIMAYRYKNTFYVNMNLILNYLDIPNSWSLNKKAKAISTKSEQICYLLSVLEKSDLGNIEIVCDKNTKITT